MNTRETKSKLIPNSMYSIGNYGTSSIKRAGKEISESLWARKNTNFAN